jgi:cellulose synthase/poly-beta-1,6-N-acetylglucosamine synthase-like glycosyltransferase
MRLKYPKEKYEIAVIDGESTDRTCEIVKEYPVKLIIDKEGGLANSRNIGIKNAKGDYIASTDADCVVKEDWLKILVDSVQEAPEDVVAVGGPNLIFENDPPFAKLVGYMQETFFASGGAPQSYKINESKYVFSIHNCNILYKKDILIEDGGFDENFNVGEDAELNFRLRQKGYKFLYMPDIVVWHRRPDNPEKFIKKMFLYGESMAKITKKHKKIVRWYAFLPSFAMFALLFAYPLIKLIPLVIYVYLFGASIYAIGLIISTVQVYQSYKSSKSLLSFVLLPIQHLSYGVGFLKGIIGGK